MTRTMRQWITAATVTAAGMVLAGPVGGVSPEQTQSAAARIDFARGTGAYEQVDYAAAASFLANAINAGLEQPDRSRAREYLAVSQYYLREQARAIATLRQLFSEFPGYTPSPQLSPDVMALFDEAREEAKTLLQLRDALKQATNETLAAQEAIAALSAKSSAELTAVRADAKLAADTAAAAAAAALAAAESKARAAELAWWDRDDWTKRLGIMWVAIPAGTFDRGCSGERDKVCEEFERPTATLRVAPFRLMATEVTVGMFSSYAADRGVGVPAQAKNVGQSYPVTNVTFGEAVGFCQALHARLPTETEWEYAARAGSKTAYWWGDAPDRERAHGNGRNGQPRLPTHQNPWGLFDMLGSVWEWTSSPWLRYTTPPGPEVAAAGDPRVIRGGSWRTPWADLRVSKRAGLLPDKSQPELGFRCAISTP